MRTRRVLCLLLAIFLLAALLPQALAAGSIETDRAVTLTVRFFHDKTPVSGAPFSLYRVADVSAYGAFTLTGDFKDDPVRLDDLSSDGWRALAETLRALVLQRGRRPLDSGVTAKTGLLTFPARQRSLRPGLYLLLGESFVSGGYSYTVEPSLICLPCADEVANVWDYDAQLAPKHSREPLPPAPADDTLERKVLKVWDDGNAAARPQEITIQLLKDGAVYDTVRLNAKNSWRYTWTKLPEYDASGRRISWTVAETAVSGYTVSIRQEGVTFVVTNSKSPSTPAQPSTPAGPSLPQTGTVWWPVALLALCGAALLLAGLRCKKGKHDA